MYHEKLSSPWTSALFLALMLIFGLLAASRWQNSGWDALTILLAGLGAVFLFYTWNYRTLEISLSAQELVLKFGVFTWRVPLSNVAGCALDDRLAPLERYGGAGIHFMSIDGRYRASLNFLEYPRIVIALKRQVGPVRDVSFTTRRPEDVLRLLRAAAKEQAAHAIV